MVSDFVRGFSEAKETRHAGGVQFLTHNAGPIDVRKLRQLKQCRHLHFRQELMKESSEGESVKHLHPI
jgi:hypothetical protein